MTRDNHLLGKFDISGVLPVPRGVPQIDNQLGVGQPSSRLVFRTTSLREEELEVVEGERPSPAQCCQTAGVSSDCQPLCTFDLDTASLANLTAVCSQQLDRVVRCGAGGRDQLQCCRRRAVPTSCLPLCQAVHQAHTGADFLQCQPHVQTIFTCYEEGTVSLPPPVKDFLHCQGGGHQGELLNNMSPPNCLTNSLLLSRFYSSGGRVLRPGRLTTMKFCTRSWRTMRRPTSSSRATSR